MNKYNLDEGNDAIKRALLLMKYDMNKTLTENTEKVDEVINEDRKDALDVGTAAGAAIGAGSALATGAGTAAAGAGVTTAVAFPGAAAVGGTVASTGLISSVGTFLTLGPVAASAVVGGLVGAALVPLAYWLITKDTGSAATQVKKAIQMCSTNASKIVNLKRKVSDGRITQLSDKLYDSIEGLGTEEEYLYDVFRELKKKGSFSDFCALVNEYNMERGDIYNDIDGDIDAPEEWEQIYRPVRDMVKVFMKDIGKQTIQDCKQNSNHKKCQPIKQVVRNKKTTSKWHHCKDNYSKGCTSGVIGKVQACLNVKVDDKFGPQTENALKNKTGKTTFTNADVDSICSTTVTTTKKIDEPLVIEPQGINDLMAGL
jgi:hypothetical protein